MIVKKVTFLLAPMKTPTISRDFTKSRIRISFVAYKFCRLWHGHNFEVLTETLFKMLFAAFRKLPVIMKVITQPS
jgi:hypothetical protein